MINQRFHLLSPIILVALMAMAVGGEPPRPPSTFDRLPLDPAAHPLHGERVNRERVYDFYAKQAIEALTRTSVPALLPPWPGLDTKSGAPKPGHFGNQTESDWRSDSWNVMDCGSVRANGIQLDRACPRAIAVRMGAVAAVFDPDTVTWPAAWTGGFVTQGTTRLGLLEGFHSAGTAIAAPGGKPAKRGEFTYRGYYRHGERAVFAYERDGVEWLESASDGNGAVTVQRERRGDGPLTALTRGGPARWPQTFTTRGRLGTGPVYAFDEITPPAQTPWNTLWHFGDHDFLPNGDAAVCTVEGDVWIVSGLDATLAQVTWRRFAAGLNQALGLRVVDGKICVLGRDQITRLHDLNGDGEADFHECLCNAYASVASGHDYITGLQRDAEGRFLFASGLQGIVRTSRDLKSVEVLATGLRNPNGLALGPAGEIAVTPQEGDWTPASMVCEFLPSAKGTPHFGYGGPKTERGAFGHVAPLAYLPRAEDNSSGGPCYVEGDRWGVPAGTRVHLSWGMGTAFLVLRERIGEVAQGCVVPLPGNFRSGPHRGRFHPRDGQLYVTGMTGWITYTPDAGCFTRVRYVGSGPAHTPIASEAHENGVLLRFARPLDRTAAQSTRAYFAQQWNYRYGASYGSEEYSVRQPEQTGHDTLNITSVHVLDDGRSLFIEIPQLRPAHVLHLHCDVPGLLTRTLYLTLHQLGPAFTTFPGYTAIAKTSADPHADHQHHAVATSGPAPSPVRWEHGDPGRELRIQAAAGLQYAQRELRAKAGERLSLVFNNPDVMPHNWVLVTPDGAERVGTLANALIAAPDALARHYVPDSQDVLCHTRVVEPQQQTTIHFTAPTNPGRYPYGCTFPGHWSVMRGVLIVE